jgi:ribose 5-phosphate isomerase B
MTTIAIGCDHAGFELKQQLKAQLQTWGHAVSDFGAHSAEPSDYPQVSFELARAVAVGRCQLGVLICGTGIGTQIAANKVPGVRAAVCHDCYSARVARAHNDANVLCLGARVIGAELAREVLRIWLAEPFSGEERHVRRLAQIAAFERDRSAHGPAHRRSRAGGRGTGTAGSSPSESVRRRNRGSRS